LGFSEDKCQDRNVEIDARYSENSGGPFCLRGKLLQYRRRVVLIALGIVSETSVQMTLRDPARRLKRARQTQGQWTEHVPVRRLEADTDNGQRRYCESWDVSLYLLSL